MALHDPFEAPHLVLVGTDRRGAELDPEDRHVEARHLGPQRVVGGVVVKGLVAALRQAGRGEIEARHAEPFDLVAQDLQLLVLVGIRLVDLREADEAARILLSRGSEILREISVDVVVLQDRGRDARVVHRGDDHLGRRREIRHVGRQKLHVGRLAGRLPFETAASPDAETASWRGPPGTGRPGSTGPARRCGHDRAGGDRAGCHACAWRAADRVDGWRRRESRTGPRAAGRCGSGRRRSRGPSDALRRSAGWGRSGRADRRRRD